MNIIFKTYNQITKEKKTKLIRKKLLRNVENIKNRIKVGVF